MTATQLNKGVDHFRLGLLFAVGSAFTFGHVRPAGQGTDGRRLDPHRARSPRGWRSARW